MSSHNGGERPPAPPPAGMPAEATPGIVPCNLGKLREILQHVQAAGLAGDDTPVVVALPGQLVLVLVLPDEASPTGKSLYLEGR